MSHKKLSPIIVKVSVLGYFPLYSIVRAGQYRRYSIYINIFLIKYLLKILKSIHC